MDIVYCYECKYCTYDAFANARCEEKNRYIFMYDKVCNDYVSKQKRKDKENEKEN